MDAAEQLQNKNNLIAVAHRGRDPDLQLQRGSDSVSLRQWGSEILDMVGELCDLLDVEGQPKVYCNSLTQQLHKIHDPSQTPSGRMLQELIDNDEDFAAFGLRQSAAHKERSVSLPVEKQKELQRTVAESIDKQKQIEASDKVSFEEFLKDYHAQLLQS